MGAGPVGCGGGVPSADQSPPVVGGCEPAAPRSDHERETDRDRSAGPPGRTARRGPYLVQYGGVRVEEEQPIDFEGMPVFEELPPGRALAKLGRT